MRITELSDYDKRRKKIVLEEGAECFLLYSGECRALRISEGEALSEASYRRIMDEILKPRARKKALYLLKDGDKTEAQIRRKLKEGFYPEAVIADVLSFLSGHRFVDDAAYAERYAESQRQTRSRREIAAKLAQRGIGRETIAEELAGLGEEDEEAACLHALKRQYGRRLLARQQAVWDADMLCGADFTDGGKASASEELRAEERRAYAYLARRGFSQSAIRAAFRQLSEALSEGRENDGRWE